MADRVSLTHVLIKAAAVVLGDFPDLYAAFSGRELVYSESVRINLPVAEADHVEYVTIDSPESKSVGEIAAEVRDEVARIRSGRGTFYGVLLKAMHTPPFFRKLLNSIPVPPHQALQQALRQFPDHELRQLRRRDRRSRCCLSGDRGPLCRPGQGWSPATLPLTLVFDHRCIDGARGGHFLCAMKSLLEERALSLFE